jgi:tetratricopeptide (TPR) repeat protein
MAQARELDETEKLVEAHRSLGGALFFLGDLPAARDLCAAGIAIERRDLASSRTPESVYQPVLGCRAFGSWSLWLLGFADQALAMSREGLAVARRLGQPYDLALALSAVSLVHLLRRESREAKDLAAEQIELAAGHRLAVPLASGKLLYGGSLVEEGLVEEGLEWLRDGEAAWRAAGALSNFTFHAGYLLAQAYGKKDDPDAGLALVEESLALVEGRGERFFEPGIYLVKAELLAMRRSVDASAIETLLQHALSTARRQRSQALELRAALALGRRWALAGREEAAHAMLRELLGRLPEGHRTADLRDADLLIAELSGAVEKPAVGVLQHRM